jgi:hypothetical protein
VLLLAVLPFLRRLARDPDVMGEYRLRRAGSIVTGVTIAVIAASVLALLVLSVV